MIEIAEEELPDCTTRVETWNLIEDEFMDGRLKVMKGWLEEIKKRFKQGRIDEEETIRKLEMEEQKEEEKRRKEVNVRMIQAIGKGSAKNLMEFAKTLCL
jgi:hypothetical protein